MINAKIIHRDSAKAVHWYKKVAKQGNPLAQFVLGEMYARGDGVIQNLKKAYKWYKKAASKVIH